MNVHFIGMLKSPVSWAKVGREIVQALAAAGHYVSAVSLKGFLYDEKFALEPEVEAAINAPRLPGWDVALDYPPNFSRLNGVKRAGILIYEADLFPPHWARAVRENLDLALVPSRFCLEAAAAAGVPRGTLVVAPFGVNTQVYKPTDITTTAQATGGLGAMTGKTFNFLTVAAPHVRKGLAETTEAFCRAFGPSEDVGLVIKCPPLGQLGRRPWEYKSVGEFLPEGRGRQVFLAASTLSEDDISSLYRSAQVYVQASYGEGFGLSLLEACACGKPVVATGWGGAMEFLDRSCAWLVDYDLIDASKIAYDWPAGEGRPRMARPRIEALAAAFREAYEENSGRWTMGETASRTASRHMWGRWVDSVYHNMTMSS